MKHISSAAGFIFLASASFCLPALAEPGVIVLRHGGPVTERNASTSAQFDCGERHLELTWTYDRGRGVILSSMDIDGADLPQTQIEKFNTDMGLEETVMTEFIGASLVECDAGKDRFHIAARKRHAVGNTTMITEYWMRVAADQLIPEGTIEYIVP